MLPGTLTLLGGYDLTYGSLAGVMIALIFVAGLDDAFTALVDSIEAAFA